MIKVNLTKCIRQVKNNWDIMIFIVNMVIIFNLSKHPKASYTGGRYTDWNRKLS